VKSLVALAICFLLAGCSAPFGVRHASPEKVHRSLTANVLSTGELSNFSQIALHRRNLTEAFDDDPEATLRDLHDELRAGRLSTDDLYVLAELSFHHATHDGGKPHFLAAAVYAYAYVFPGDPHAAPPPFDPRQRVAMDLYNRALTEAFESPNGDYVEPAGGQRPLPFGEIDISFDEGQLRWEKRQLTKFSPAAELEVIGFQNRYRQPGIGAPLAAATQPADENDPMQDFVGPNVRVPVTALLRLANPRQQILGTRLAGELELHPGTHALCTGAGQPDPACSTASPAIDAGAGCLFNDQRGLPRPQNGTCDIGAFEVEVEGLPPPLDHFKCYKAKDLKQPKFVSNTVALTDQFGVNDGLFEMKKPFLFCTPVSKNGEAISNLTDHLTCYKIKGPKLENAERQPVEVSNQFGSLQLEVKKPFLLCVPSSKSVFP
jgi:hypothetical protein